MAYPQQTISVATYTAQKEAPAPQDVPAQPRLNRLQEEVGRITETANHALQRTRAIADHLLGPIPTSNKACAEPNPCGVVEDLGRRIQDLGAVVAMLHDEIGRLESL